MAQQRPLRRGNQPARRLGGGLVRRKGQHGLAGQRSRWFGQSDSRHPGLLKCRAVYATNCRAAREGWRGKGADSAPGRAIRVKTELRWA